MSDAIPINEAKTRFSELVRRAEAGEEILIRRGPVTVARLGPVHTQAGLLAPGSLGRMAWMDIRDDFDDPLPEFDDYRASP